MKRSLSTLIAVVLFMTSLCILSGCRMNQAYSNQEILSYLSKKYDEKFKVTDKDVFSGIKETVYTIEAIDNKHIQFNVTVYPSAENSKVYKIEDDYAEYSLYNYMDCYREKFAYPEVSIERVSQGYNVQNMASKTTILYILYPSYLSIDQAVIPMEEALSGNVKADITIYFKCSGAALPDNTICPIEVKKGGQIDTEQVKESVRESYLSYVRQCGVDYEILTDEEKNTCFSQETTGIGVRQNGADTVLSDFNIVNESITYGNLYRLLPHLGINPTGRADQFIFSIGETEYQFDYGFYDYYFYYLVNGERVYSDSDAYYIPLTEIEAITSAELFSPEPPDSSNLS